MKICHVTCVHKQNDGRIFSKECSSLAKEPDFEVYLSAEGESHTTNNVKVIGNGDIPNNRLKRMFKFSKKVVATAKETKADIYHIHDPELLRYAMQFKKSGAIVIFDSHENVIDEIEEKQYLPGIVRKLAKIYFKALLSYTLKRIDGIVIVTPQQERVYEKLNKNIVMVPNYPIVGTDLEDEIEKKQGRAVFAGIVSDLWSQEEVIHAIDAVDGIEYRVFGPSSDSYIEKLGRYSGWKKAKYYGNQPFEVVQNELKQAYCAFALLKPCRNTFYMEGTMGNTKLFEAMYNQTPVIATNFELWKEVVEKNKCGYLVDPNNVQEIRNALERIMSLSEEEVIKMGRNGRRAVIEKYSWTNANKNLLSFYRQLIKKDKEISSI